MNQSQSSLMVIEPAFEELESSEGRVLRFSGRWTLSRIADLPARLDEVGAGQAKLDLSGVDRIDTVGAWVIYKLAMRLDAPVTGANPDAAKLLSQVAAAGQTMEVRPAPSFPFFRAIEEIGQATLMAFATAKGMLSFFGSIMIASFDVIRHPRRFRVNAVIQHFELVGIRALAIIGLMNFLVGLVVAQQGALQLAAFGAESLTVNMIGRITTRELGVLMTAIMVAGRSASAFAAQLGTMKLTEEVDAMRTIGVSPIEALVIPRLLAATIMMPLLGFFASIVAITGGGLLCWLVLDIPPGTFVQSIRDVTPITDVYIGLLKAPVFGAIIAMTGCYQGLQVEGNSEQVGLRTTAAVVQAIFLVIVLDAFFAVFFTAVGWE